MFAEYEGMCPGCRTAIKVGDRIRSTDDGWMHEVCDDEGLRRIEAPLCSTCFLRHPDGACDL